MPAPLSTALLTRLEGLLAFGLAIAFLLPWIARPVPLTGLELVSLARGRQAEQAEAILLVAYAAIPVTALLTLAAALLRHGVGVCAGTCGTLAVLGIGLLWLARQVAGGGAADLGLGAWLTLLLGALLLAAAMGLMKPLLRRG